jgi:hypothetical protein
MNYIILQKTCDLKSKPYTARFFNNIKDIGNNTIRLNPSNEIDKPQEFKNKSKICDYLKTLHNKEKLYKVLNISNDKYEIHYMGSVGFYNSDLNYIEQYKKGFFDDSILNKSDKI